MFEKQQLELITDLSSDARLLFADNLSPLSSQWLRAIPYNKYTSLSKEEIAVGLSVRTLVTGHHIVCRYCALPNELGHDEVCMDRHGHRVARHEAIKKILAYHLKLVPNTEVQLEPHLVGRNDRTDLRINGQGSYLQASSDYDVAIVSIFSRVAIPPPASDDPKHLLQAAKNAIHIRLASKADEKRRHYNGLTPGAFHPVIISSGGSLEKKAQLILEFWQTLMPPQNFSALQLALSISLLRARGRTWIV